MVAPISGDSPGLVRAQVSHGVRQVRACQNIVGISHVGACQHAVCIRQFRCREYWTFSSLTRWCSARMAPAILGSKWSLSRGYSSVWSPRNPPLLLEDSGWNEYVIGVINYCLIRFGDQILQVNGENLAGYSSDKVYGILKKVSVNNIVMAVRDRPFERALTLHKVDRESCCLI